MKAQEFIRRLRRFARKRGVPVEITPGKGDHVKVRLGEAFTILPGKRGELRKGTFHAICQDLNIDPDKLQERRLIYPAHFQAEPEGGYTVTFRDLPGVSFGDTIEEARHMAVDALASALSFYAENAKPFPKASAPRPGEHLIFVPALIQAKLALVKRMAELKLSNVDLANRLNVDEKAIRRLVNLNHESKLSKIEAALALLGKRLEVMVEEVT